MTTHSDREKVKDTKKLVRLALADGWTEAEIARKCRVDADKVSAWKNGKARGRRHELAPLLERFAWRLRRGKARVYLTLDPEAGPKWEETEEGRRLLAAVQELESLESQHAELRKVIQAIAPHSSPDDLRERAVEVVEQCTADLRAIAEREANAGRRRESEDEFESHRPRWDFDIEDEPHFSPEEEQARVTALRQRRDHARELLGITDDALVDLQRIEVLKREMWPSADKSVERARAAFDETHQLRTALVGGRVVFSYLFSRPMQSIGRDPRLRRLAVARWVVHHDGSEQFILVCQRRRPLSEQRAAVWKESLSTAQQHWRGSGTHEASVTDSTLVDAREDAARWLAEIHPPMDLGALIAYIDASISAPDRPHGPNDEVTLPFLLRKALIEHGFDVPGVQFYGMN